jgi:hypothetical protein
VHGLLDIAAIVGEVNEHLLILTWIARRSGRFATLCAFRKRDLLIIDTVFVFLFFCGKADQPPTEAKNGEATIAVSCAGRQRHERRGIYVLCTGSESNQTPKGVLIEAVAGRDGATPGSSPAITPGFPEINPEAESLFALHSPKSPHERNTTLGSQPPLQLCEAIRRAVTATLGVVGGVDGGLVRQPIFLLGRSHVGGMMWPDTAPIKRS